MLREYNPNEPSCNHNFTASRDEHDGLVALGWHDEGVGWYAAALPAALAPAEPDLAAAL